jgi:hypothetical protein
MKMMMLNKTLTPSMDTTSDDRTTTNSFSLNTYSQDFSVDKIYQYDSSISSYKQRVNNSLANQNNPSNQWCSSSSTNSSCQDKQIPLSMSTLSPQHLLTAVGKKRNTSSDSDAITTTTTTTLTNSIQYGG